MEYSRPITGGQRRELYKELFVNTATGCEPKEEESTWMAGQSSPCQVPTYSQQPVTPNWGKCATAAVVNYLWNNDGPHLQNCYISDMCQSPSSTTMGGVFVEYCPKQGENSTSFLADSGLGVIGLKCKTLLTLTFDARLAGQVVDTFTRSRVFAQRFLQYVRYFGARKFNQTVYIADDVPMKTDNDTMPGFHEQISSVIEIDAVIDESARYPLDYRWNKHIIGLVSRQLLLEDAMAWLSTLGGGYSALGDYDEYFAEQAGKISLKQFRIALEMGDPPTVIRCHLYMALSLMQRGQLHSAKHIIRRQYQLTNDLTVSDHRLVAMCCGLWNRLRYLWANEQNERRVRKQSSGS